MEEYTVVAEEAVKTRAEAMAALLSIAEEDNIVIPMEIVPTMGVIATPPVQTTSQLLLSRIYRVVAPAISIDGVRRQMRSC